MSTIEMFFFVYFLKGIQTNISHSETLNMSFHLFAWWKENRNKIHQTVMFFPTDCDAEEPF